MLRRQDQAISISFICITVKQRKVYGDLVMRIWCLRPHNFLKTRACRICDVRKLMELRLESKSVDTTIL